MEIVVSIASFITMFFLLKLIFNLCRQIWGRIFSKNNTEKIQKIKKKTKHSGITFVICYVATIILGIMAGGTEGAYTTTAIIEDAEEDTNENIEESHVEENVAENVSEVETNDEIDVTDKEWNHETEQDEEIYSEEEVIDYSQEENYNEDEISDDEFYEEVSEQEAEWEYTKEEMEKKASTYTTLLNYSYDNSRKAKNITTLLKDSKEAEETEFSYVSENKKLTSDKKTYEITINKETNFIYYGKTKNDKPDGYGILYYDRYPVYIGEFSKGVKEGYGIEIECSGLYDAFFVSYEGNFKDGLRNGEGKKYQEYVEDVVLDSYFHAVDMYKKQVLKYMDLRYDLPLIENPIKYEGDFKDGSYSGKGILYYVKGTAMYEGDFKSGEYEGTGTLYYDNKQIWYKGSFKNGKYDGKGTLYYKNGEIQYKGKFKNGDVE